MVTGATGFIGIHMTKRLIKEGHTVYVLMRPKSKQRRRFNDEVGLIPHVIEANFLDREAVRIAFNRCQPEVCIHLAWCPVAGGHINGIENIQYVDATMHLAECLFEVGCHRLIVTGTCLEYDTTVGYLAENTPLKPNSLYAACKHSLFEMLTQWASIRGVNLTWIRPFYMYGPYESENRLVPHVISSLLRGEFVKLTEGYQMRDYLYIDDVVSAIYTVIAHRIQGPINVGSGEPVTVRQIVDILARSFHGSKLIKYGVKNKSKETEEPLFICANIDKLRNQTNWKSRFGLEEGLKATIEWWQKAAI
ncbi:NAD-dependent epimerase/dehydratase family protein [Pajaroellobacter abortibovis]|nr:NAD(P)-dependent oxidoreductase [Pajaroellobacter abortibovis]